MKIRTGEGGSPVEKELAKGTRQVLPKRDQAGRAERSGDRSLWQELKVKGPLSGRGLQEAEPGVGQTAAVSREAGQSGTGSPAPRRTREGGRLGRPADDRSSDEDEPPGNDVKIGPLPDSEERVPGDAPLFGASWWARLVDRRGPTQGSGRTLHDLREAASMEICLRIDEGWIPEWSGTSLTHRNIKLHTWGYDQYEDKGNLAGSLCCLLLLLPGEFRGCRGTDFGLLKWIDPSGDLAPKIRELGKEKQKSGKGPNNFRNDIVEAILSSLGPLARACRNTGRT